MNPGRKESIGVSVQSLAYHLMTPPCNGGQVTHDVIEQLVHWAVQLKAEHDADWIYTGIVSTDFEGKGKNKRKEGRFPAGGHGRLHSRFAEHKNKFREKHGATVLHLCGLLFWPAHRPGQGSAICARQDAIGLSEVEKRVNLRLEEGEHLHPANTLAEGRQTKYTDARRNGPFHFYVLVGRYDRKPAASSGPAFIIVS